MARSSPFWPIFVEFQVIYGNIYKKNNLQNTEHFVTWYLGIGKKIKFNYLEKIYGPFIIM